MKIYKKNIKKDIVVQKESEEHLDDLDGFHNDMSNNDYHGDLTHFSSSSLKMLLKDERKFHSKYVLKEDQHEEENTNFIVGSYIHSLILEPHLTKEEFAIHNGTRRGKAYKEFKEINRGKDIVTATEHEMATQMIFNYKKNEYAPQLISDGQAEQSLFTHINKVPIKVRPDYVYVDAKSGYIVDVKTTGDKLDRASLMRIVGRFDYDLSAALYVDAYEQQLGVPFNFFFIFLSKKEPYEVIAIKASRQLIDNGRRKYVWAMRKYEKGLETGIWYKEGIQELYIFKSDMFEIPEED